MLPVFHFHETTRAALEPAFQYLATNRYHSITADEMAAIVDGRQSPPPKAVLLAFDDALASLWLVAYPLLRHYGLRAVAYAIPGRVVDAPQTRPTMEDREVDAAAADAGAVPLATWPELKEMANTGWVDVQSHTWSHSMIFCKPRIVDVLRPDRPPDLYFSRPRLNMTDPPLFLANDRFGYPLFPRRSRMSDALRYLPDDAAVEKVESFVTNNGGAAFFAHPSWRSRLKPLLASVTGRSESDEEHRRAIEHELLAGRDVLEARLGKKVRHLCLPWGVTGQVATHLIKKTGFETAVANRWRGQYGVRSGDHPHFLKRLPHRHIFALPGEGRRAFRTLV